MRKELINSIQVDKLQVQKGEEKILDLLQNSRGMLLDDVELIEQLKVSKEVSKAIQDKIVQSEIKEKDITKVIDQYSKLALWGTLLYFCI
jgi:dynein heavy chain